jgi:hypothetical protein
MSDHDEESALHEKPLEFITSIANSGGYCDGQAILPHEDGTRRSCSRSTTRST